ncbi:proline iminopeptidase [Armillaria fumosa]|nr:proline iminopeptidase [Armillaria fumosa]
MASTTEGLIPFTYQGEQYHTWYKVYGSLDNRTRTPLICLHGGPGLSYDYLSPLADLTKSSVPVIFYDQIGNSRSTHLKEKPASFWNIDLFIDELANLIGYFNIQDDFDILGHSWGGILGLEYELRRQPAGLKHLILTNSLADMGLWNKSTAELSKAFPEDVQKGLAISVADMEVYSKALAQFHKKHGCLVQPWPEDFLYSIKQATSPGADISVTVGMFTGELGTWTSIGRLDRVRVPTFVINGRADIAQDFVVEPFFKSIRRVKWITMESSSHTPMWEEKERYIELIDKFVKL